MSPLAQAVTAAPARRAEPRSARRLDLIVPSLPRRPAPFSVLLGSLLLAAIVAVLMLTIYISENSFKIANLSQELAELETQRDYLDEDIAYRSSPQNVVTAAQDLGMELDRNPIYIDLDSGSTSSLDDAPAIPDTPGEDVPAPRPDIRDDSRPDLKTNRDREIIDPSAPPVAEHDGSDTFPAPPQRTPGAGEGR